MPIFKENIFVLEVRYLVKKRHREKDFFDNSFFLRDMTYYIIIIRGPIKWPLMMIIALNSRAHKGKNERGEVKREYGGVCGEEEGNADYGGMVPFWAGIPVEDT